MGTFRVEVMLGNPYSAARETVAALVDTGSTFSVMPASLLRRLGIEPTRTRRLRLANGQVEERQTGMACFEVDGIDCEAMVVFGRTISICWCDYTGGLCCLWFDR